MSDCALRVEGIDKFFGPTHANVNISLEVARGEVRGLAGENGSGKSTLASIICGINKRDAGKMWVNGQAYEPDSPIDASSKGVSMVVQELGMVTGLPASVNMFLGRTDQFKKMGLIDNAAMNVAARKELEKWGFGGIHVNLPARQLSIEDRKIVELARALSTDPDVLILDEISQTLSHDRRQELYKLLDSLKAAGKAIILISHDLEEMLHLTDTVSILRDGVVVDTCESKSLPIDVLKRKMVGREVSGEYYRNSVEPEYSDDVILKVEHLSVPGELEDISFELHRNEILGVCGLTDAGIHTLGLALYGLSENRTGQITYVPQKQALNTPQQMIRARGAYLSKDRDQQGLMLDTRIRENIVLPSLKDYGGILGYIPNKRTRDEAVNAFEAFEIKATGINHVVRRLSGGNKQKVNLSRWMIRDLDFIILDCPTRGVDVGVKAYIYDVIEKARKRGLAILLISDELTEAIGMSDRIMIMKNGRVVKTVDRSAQLDEETIVEEMI